MGPRRSGRQRRQAIIAYTALTAALSATNLPQTYQEARESSEWPHWEKAMDEELAKMKHYGVWEAIKNEGQRTLDGKWVFTRKIDGSSGLPSAYNARYVVKGFRQIEGKDYNELFTSVTHKDSIRVFLSIVNHLDLECHQVDIKGAFLNGVIDKLIFLTPPDGSDIPANNILRLNKSLYGLKQSPRLFNQALDKWLRSTGMVPTTADSCVYVRHKDGNLPHAIGTCRRSAYRRRQPRRTYGIQAPTEPQIRVLRCRTSWVFPRFQYLSRPTKERNSTSPKNTTSRPYWRSTACQTAIQHVHPFQADSGQSQQQRGVRGSKRPYRTLKSQELYSTRPQSQTGHILCCFSALPIHFQVEQVPLASSKTPTPIPSRHKRFSTYIRCEGKPASCIGIRRCRLGRLPGHQTVIHRLCIQDIWWDGSLEESTTTHCRPVHNPSRSPSLDRCSTTSQVAPPTT